MKEVAEMQIGMKYAESLFLIVCGALSTVFLVVSFDYSDMARAVPNICAVFVLLCVLFRLTQIWRRSGAEKVVLKVHKRAGPFIAMLAGYTAGVSLLGLMLASALFIPICMYWMGHRRLTLIAIITAGYLVLVYLVFVVGFRMPLPDSLLGL